MATATTSRTTRKATSKTSKVTRPRTTPRKKFNGDYEDGDWNKIPSKGMLYSLAIAAYNGAKFPGSEFLGSRTAAKEMIEELVEAGFIEKRGSN